MDSQEEKNLKTDLTNKILRLVHGDIDTARAKLKELTTWTNDKGQVIQGKSETSQLSIKQVRFLIEKVNKMITEAENSGQLPPETSGDTP